MPHLQVQLAHYGATVWGKSYTPSLRRCWSQQGWERMQAAFLSVEELLYGSGQRDMIYYPAGGCPSKFILQTHPRPDTGAVWGHERASDKNGFIGCYLAPPTQWVTDAHHITSRHKAFPPRARSGHRFHDGHQLVGVTTNPTSHICLALWRFFHRPPEVTRSQGQRSRFTSIQSSLIPSIHLFIYLFIFACVGNIDQNSKTEYKQSKECNWSFVTRKCFQ